MNFRLPLVGIGGRGGAGYTVTLPIEQHWTVDKYVDPDDPALTTFMANGNWWEVVKPGYCPGVMQRRMVAQSRRTATLKLTQFAFGGGQ
jgi:hypothetical protein